MKQLHKHKLTLFPYSLTRYYLGLDGGSLGASMMYYSHIIEENKELRQYVDQYV